MNAWREALARWGEADFESACKRAIAAMDPAHLPLQQGLRHGGMALDDGIEAVILAAEDGGEEIVLKVGLFYKSVISGCSCADDPTPIDEMDEYCELALRVGKEDGTVRVRLL